MTCRCRKCKYYDLPKGVLSSAYYFWCKHWEINFAFRNLKLTKCKRFENKNENEITPDSKIAELQLLLRRIGGIVFTTLNMFDIPDYATMKGDIEAIDKIIKENQQLINSK